MIKLEIDQERAGRRTRLGQGRGHVEDTGGSELVVQDTTLKDIPIPIFQPISELFKRGINKMILTGIFF